MRVLIVGAGIAGLTLAAFLEQQNIYVEIIERAENWKKQGYFLGLLPHGANIFKRLGMYDALKEQGSTINATVFHDDTGRMVQRIVIDAIVKRYGPLITISRDSLHRLLRERIRTGIQMNIRITSIQQHKDIVTVTFSNDIVGEYDLVVGADGVRSQLRSAIFPKVQPKFLGLTNYVLKIPTLPHSSHSVSVFKGLDRVFAICPIGKENLSAYHIIRNERRDLKEEVTKNDVQNSYPLAQNEFGHFLESLDERPVLFKYDHVEVKAGAWYSGRVVLIGDAAHAMSPLLGMGGSMAIEDAYVLASELGKSDVPIALKMFRRKRHSRVRFAQILTRVADQLTSLALPRPLYIAELHIFAFGVDKILRYGFWFICREAYTD